MKLSLRERKRDFWEKNPCGAADIASLPEGSLEYFEAVEQMRYQGDDFMPDVVGFDQWAGKKVLEVGCGMGTDLLQFARGGATVHGIDLTEKAVSLTRTRLGLYGFGGTVLIANSESIPFADNYFDLVYSWGVVHHAMSPETAAREILRVCKPGGRVMIMVYNRRSLVALQAWLYYGLLRGKPTRSATELLGEHLQSPGTRVYTPDEALALLDGSKDKRAQTIVTRYDLRVGRRAYLPRWFRSIVPPQFGWFIVVSGTKS
jgi:ubiquinone/menaquinone biosynthesis C-methylase UbiE